jgi:beta-lactam-binding protein with PASTA domain
MTYEEVDPDEPRGWSPLAVAMIATLVLLLGLAGALFGIYVSNVNAQAAVVTSPTPQPEVITTPPVSPTTTKPATPSPSVTPSSTPTATVPADAFALPKLDGLNFKDARTMVRELKLGWTLTFLGNGNDQTVKESTPAAGTLVQKGTTITIVVKGAAPPAVIPVITGKQCAVAADLIIDAGLYPDYKTAARTGAVLPAAPQLGLKWNDKMSLTCAG